MRPTRQRPSNADLVNEYLAHCQTLNRSRDTIYSYSRSLRSLVVFFNEEGAGVHLTDATPDDLRRWLDLPRQRLARGSGPLAPATRKRKIMELRSFYKWLHEVRNLVYANPARRIEAPTVYNEDPRPVPDEAWRTLWFSDLCDSDRVAFGLAYFCGLRRHEVTLLAPWNFVDLPQPRLANMRRKGGSRSGLPYASCVQMVAERMPSQIGDPDRMFLAPLRRIRQERESERVLLPWRMEAHKRRPAVDPVLGSDFVLPDYYNKRLRYALRRAGLPERAFSPHALRHSFCTNLVRMGVDLLTVARLANHSSVVVTQRYVRSEEDPLQAFLSGPQEELALAPIRRWR